MPLPKSVLCAGCKKTYPEGWRRCPYCGFDASLQKRDSHARRFMDRKVQEFEQKTGTGTARRKDEKRPPGQRPQRERQRGQQQQGKGRPSQPRGDQPRGDQARGAQPQSRGQRPQRGPQPRGGGPPPAEPRFQQMPGGDPGQPGRSRRRRRRGRGSAGQPATGAETGTVNQTALPPLPSPGASRHPLPQAGEGNRLAGGEGAKKRRRVRRRRRGGGGGGAGGGEGPSTPSE